MVQQTARAGRSLDRVEALERRLQVRRRARQEGLVEQPASEAAEPSPVELEIAELVAAERQHLAQAASAAVQGLERDLRRAGPVAESLAAVFAEGAAQLRRVEGRLGPSFARLRQSAAKIQGELEGFRAEHALRRPPVYPDSPLLQAALLALAAAFEAAFSATLFANASDAGLLGGAALALGLSGANVALGFLAGFLGLRYLQHRRWPPRAAGGLLAGLAALAALGLNAFAALWREQVEGATPLQLADRASLLGLTEPKAVVLLMLGLAVWVFATLKGYSGFDDPYPDYGKLDRAARRAEEALEEAREELRAELEAPLDAAGAQAQTIADSQRQAVAAMRAAYERTADRLLDLAAQSRRSGETGAALIQLYRDENRAARRTPPPAAFARPPAWEAEAESDPLARAAELLGAAEAQLQRLQQELAAGLASLGAKLEEASERLEAVA